MVAVAVSIASFWPGLSGHALKWPHDGDSSSEGMNGHAARFGDLLQRRVVRRGIVIADEQQIEPGGQLRTGEVLGRRDAFRLVGVVVQVG